MPTRWTLFHVSVASTTTLNVLVLSLLGSVVHPVLAACAGIAVGSVVNFLLNDRLVFR